MGLLQKFIHGASGAAGDVFSSKIEERKQMRLAKMRQGLQKENITYSDTLARDRQQNSWDNQSAVTKDNRIYKEQQANQQREREVGRYQDVLANDGQTVIAQRDTHNNKRIAPARNRSTSSANKWHNTSNDAVWIPDPDSPENEIQAISQYRDDGSTRLINLQTGKPVDQKSKSIKNKTNQHDRVKMTVQAIQSNPASKDGILNRLKAINPQGYKDVVRALGEKPNDKTTKTSGTVTQKSESTEPLVQKSPPSMSSSAVNSLMEHATQELDSLATKMEDKSQQLESRHAAVLRYRDVADRVKKLKYFVGNTQFSADGELNKDNTYYREMLAELQTLFPQDISKTSTGLISAAQQ